MATLFRSEENATMTLLLSKISIDLRGEPSAAFQIRIVSLLPSHALKPAEATCLPSAQNSTLVSSYLCPSRSRSGFGFFSILALESTGLAGVAGKGLTLSILANRVGSVGSLPLTFWIFAHDFSRAGSQGTGMPLAATRGIPWRIPRFIAPGPRNTVASGIPWRGARSGIAQSANSRKEMALPFSGSREVTRVRLMRRS